MRTALDFTQEHVFGLVLPRHRMAAKNFNKLLDDALGW
jgi:hypothetical protein